MSGLETSYFDAIYTLLPSSLKAGIDDLLSTVIRESVARHTLDQLVRFSLGRDTTEDDGTSREEWDIQQNKAGKILSSLQLEEVRKGKKRSRDDDESTFAELIANPKRPKVEATSGGKNQEDPVFTLHSVSVSSPVRKKVNITIYRKDTLRFMNATSDTQEASLPLDSLTRAFLIPTPGKSKAHWTIVILAGSDQSQIIFGLDAVPPSMTTTVHPGTPCCHPKGTESKPILMEFLSRLPPHVVFQEPSINQFRSPAGDPYLDAYLRAKDGHLFFFEDGLLFGEKRPCVWIGMEEIENVRSLSATGRTFSLFVMRIAETSQEEPGEGEETEFSLIDGKNQDSVALWVKNNRHRFGVRREEKGEDHVQSGAGEGIEREEGQDKQSKNLDRDSDDSDDSDFESDSESDGGSELSDSSGDEGTENQSEHSEATHSESDEDGGGEDPTPLRHPLLRPGAMPKMTNAAINAVVDMVKEDLIDVAVGANSGAGDDEDEFDELED